MSFQELLWTIRMLSLQILAASVIDQSRGQDRQTDTVNKLITAVCMTSDDPGETQKIL